MRYGRTSTHINPAPALASSSRAAAGQGREGGDTIASRYKVQAGGHIDRQTDRQIAGTYNINKVRNLPQFPFPRIAACIYNAPSSIPPPSPPPPLLSACYIPLESIRFIYTHLLPHSLSTSRHPRNNVGVHLTTDPLPPPHRPPIAALLLHNPIGKQSLRLWCPP